MWFVLSDLITVYVFFIFLLYWTIEAKMPQLPVVIQIVIS